MGVTLRAALDHEPRPLNFGTSGRRGDVVDLTQLEIYLNARAELDYLLALPASAGGIRTGQPFYYAHDLRPSSTHFVAAQGGRGELAQAIERAIGDAGLRPVNLGEIPTPALTAYALAQGCGSMMVTGSHIPFERNGYKTNSARGELLKRDETPIAEHVARWRERLYGEPFATSAFAANGNFKDGSHDCAAVNPAGRAAYLRRYVEFFGPGALDGLKLLVYQHSAVGRDLLVDVLRVLGATAVPCGRSDVFVPIDTEAIDDSTLGMLRHMAVAASADGSRFDTLVSTDGDSDRPLLTGLDYTAGGECTARFFGGDLVGMVVAKFLAADAVVVPVSCNDAIDRSTLAPVLAPKTRIGSPYVIEGMELARAAGARRVCGWEANGGFLTGTDLSHEGRVLPALPTRDAFLPILCVLRQMMSQRSPMAALFDALPRRYSRAALLRRFPRAASLRIVSALSPEGGVVTREYQARVARFFTPDDGFDAVVDVDTTDGVRMRFVNGDVAHVRPSGNADELRIYAVADSQARADAIAALGIAEPDGVLRRLALSFSGNG